MCLSQKNPTYIHIKWRDLLTFTSTNSAIPFLQLSNKICLVYLVKENVIMYYLLALVIWCPVDSCMYKQKCTIDCDVHYFQKAIYLVHLFITIQVDKLLVNSVLNNVMFCLCCLYWTMLTCFSKSYITTYLTWYILICVLSQKNKLSLKLISLYIYRIVPKAHIASHKWGGVEQVASIGIVTQTSASSLN